MKLRHQLMLAPWASTLTLLAAMVGAVWLLEWQDAENQRSREAASLREQVADTARATFARQQAQLYRNMAIAGALVPAELAAARARLKIEVDNATGGLTSVASGLAKGIFDPQADILVKDLAKAAWRFAKAAENALEMASIDPNTGVAALQTADAEFAKTSAVIDQLVKRVGELERKSDQAQRQQMLMTGSLMGGLGLLLTFSLLALAWRTQRRVLADVQRVAEVADQVAHGRLDDVHVGGDRDDEIGALLEAQAGMVRHLRQMVQQVRGAAQAIEASSGEVASGNMDLSRRTEQAAGSLQVSASSMMELTGSVRHSADSALRANQLAANASSVALRGGQVVSQVVATMHGISDSSRRIGDIIGTIDGIAFQTNILALNAAVEAARAGEQGRGFAVVAAEVRSLAQRSAAAAREIKALISHSVGNVDAGARLVREAGGTMEEIVAAVQRVSEMIGGITSAAQQQSGGIDQVSRAVADLDQMTQRNAALVEQSAAAAESLREQAQRLAGVVGAFAWQDQGSVQTTQKDRWTRPTRP